MNEKITESEKVAWGELAACRFQEAEAYVNGEKEKIRACAQAILALEDVIRCIHYAAQITSPRDQCILKQEADCHRQRALKEINGDNAEAQKFYLTALALKNTRDHFRTAFQAEGSHRALTFEQRAEMIVEECRMREAEMRSQGKEEEIKNRSEAVLAAKQAIQYCRRGDQVTNLLEKRALEKAAESSLLRSQALLVDQKEEASHFLWASFLQGDAAACFQQANREIDPNKKAEYFSKAEYYLQHAELWKQHQVEQAEKFSYKKNQGTRTLLPLQSK